VQKQALTFFWMWGKIKFPNRIKKREILADMREFIAIYAEKYEKHFLGLSIIALEQQI